MLVEVLTGGSLFSLRGVRQKRRKQRCGGDLASFYSAETAHRTIANSFLFERLSLSSELASIEAEIERVRVVCQSLLNASHDRDADAVSA